MNAHPDLERRLADFYVGEAPQRAPEWLLPAALATIDTTHQRRPLIRVPWRFPIMNTYAKMAVAAVAVVAVGAVGAAVLRPDQGPGVDPSTSPVPSAAETPGTSPLGPLNQRFTSTIHGITVSYPNGWNTRPARAVWDGTQVYEKSTFADVIWEKASNTPFLAVVSQPLGGTPFAEWAADYLAGVPCQPTEPVTIDGTEALISDCDIGAHAFATAGGRGYLFWLYRVDGLDAIRSILATVQLEPENAVDGPTPATESTFRHQFSYEVPVSWTGYDFGPRAGGTWEMRLPDSAGEGQSAVGVIMRAINGGRVDACAETSATAPILSGPDAVLDYLESIPRVTLTGRQLVQIGQLPAAEAMVQLAPETADCVEIRPFEKEVGIEETEVMSAAGPGLRVRVQAVDVGGSHVVIWTFATTQEWLDVADELIGTIVFD